MAYDARLPSGLEPPAVLHPEVEGGGVKSAEGRQVGEKAQEKSLVRWAVEVRLQIIEVQSRGGDRRLPETSHHSCVTF